MDNPAVSSRKRVLFKCTISIRTNKIISVSCCARTCREKVVLQFGDGRCFPITKDDMKTLEPQMYLNDAIINFYLHYISRVQLSDPLFQERIHIFSTFFYTSLITQFTEQAPLTPRCTMDAVSNEDPALQRYKKVKRSTRNVDLFKKDFIFVPINLEY